MVTSVKSKGKVYSLSIDQSKPDRNYDDENYAEWFIEQDGRIFDVTVWKGADGQLTNDATVEVYTNQGDFEDGNLLDKKNVKFREI